MDAACRACALCSGDARECNTHILYYTVYKGILRGGGTSEPSSGRVCDSSANHMLCTLQRVISTSTSTSQTSTATTLSLGGEAANNLCRAAFVRSFAWRQAPNPWPAVAADRTSAAAPVRGTYPTLPLHGLPSAYLWQSEIAVVQGAARARRHVAVVLPHR